MRRVVQPALPTALPSPDEIARKQSFAGAIELCANASGYDLDKQSSAAIGMDKAQWSRIKSGQEGIRWERLQDFMDRMGNPVPVLWMLHQCGYDLHSVRKRESELEAKLRIAEERIALLERDHEIERNAVRALIGGARP